MKKREIYFAGAFIVVVGLWAFGIYDSSQGKNTFLNSLEPLFSGVAIICLIVTIFLQQDELRQNTNALLSQKKEMEKQWQEMEEQNRNMKRQRFESTLFNMWNLHFESRNLIEVRKIRGILGFKQFVDEVIAHAYNEGTRADLNIYTSKLIKSTPIINSDTNFFTISEPYLNSLKLIYNSIKQARLQPDAEDRYVEIMKSYLTNYEVMFIVLYYNHLKGLDGEKMLTDMYEELRIGEEFGYRVEKGYGYKLIADSGLL